MYVIGSVVVGVLLLILHVDGQIRHHLFHIIIPLISAVVIVIVIVVVVGVGSLLLSL